VPESALDLKVWKELAISKQMLIRTATDALGLDPECQEGELKVALEQGIKQITEVDSIVSATKEETRASIAAIEEKLAVSEKARLENEAKINELEAQKKETETLLETTRTGGTAELKKVNAQLDEKNKALKSINVILADTPENVVRKLKSLNKKKFDETNARKRAEDEVRNLKKEKRELDKQITTHEATIELATKLAELYRELRTFSEDQYTQLKELLDDEEQLKSLPELDEELLGNFEKSE
jgi:chromosome segregation ATPase